MSSKTGQTPRVFRSDGTVYDGPRTDFNAWDRETKYLQSPQVAFGDRFIQLGQWRFGAIDEDHLSLSHQNGVTVMLYKSDGHSILNPSGNFSTWSRPISSIGVGFGDRFLQVGHFRIGDVDGNHLSVSHLAGPQAEVYRDDGVVLPGPRTDLTTFGRLMEECNLF